MYHVLIHSKIVIEIRIGITSAFSEKIPFLSISPIIENSLSISTELAGGGRQYLAID